MMRCNIQQYHMREYHNDDDDIWNKQHNLDCDIALIQQFLYAAQLTVIKYT